jgi:hypothetical protein
MIAVVLAALLVALPGAQAAASPPLEAKPSAQPDGKSRAQAIPVKNVDAEYAYLRDRRWQPSGQELIVDGKKAYDAIEVTDENGAKFKIWFDISKFYGKELGF